MAVNQQGRLVSRSDSLFAARCGSVLAGGERATGQRKMADGVDHIDIYADVEEEFNQVFNPHLAHFDICHYFI